MVIATSDHGEMGMTHGGMRQKNFQAYEETMRVPLVWSNPQLFPRPRRSDALVSHVDFLPTMAGLFGAPKQAPGRATTTRTWCAGRRHGPCRTTRCSPSTTCRPASPTRPT